MAQKTQQGTGNFALAKRTNIHISTKVGIEISRHLRFRSTTFAKKFLEEVLVKKQAVPFKKFNRDMGHKTGMMAGRYPIKAAAEFLQLIKSAEANAQAKGLNTSSLKITKLLANKASEPAGGGRHRQGTKRSHIEIEIKEMSTKKKDTKSSQNKSSSSKVETHKTEVKQESQKVNVKESITEIFEVFAGEADLKAEEMKQAALSMEQKLKEPVVTAADLLKEAQKKAAELNVKQKEQKKNKEETSKAEKLFEQLQKNGTLRDGDKE